ncbi:MAG: caspase family protein [Candidatus Binatia bacterium]
MPAPFKQINREVFAALLDKFAFTRAINAVHMHHTWRPNHNQYDRIDGHRTILGMYLYHTGTNGWQDIAQHITIAPDGTIWLGRNWNLPPASAAGHNGNSHMGPFMFEIIGDFDRGRDSFEGEQRKTVLEVIARVQLRFKLAPETLRFHNTMSPKSCPGSVIEYNEIVSAVRALHQTLAQAEEAPRSAEPAVRPFGPDASEISGVVEEALDALGREVPQAIDPGNAEPTYDDAERAIFPIASRVTAATRGSAITAQKLARLRPHLVNLNMGRFSKDGEWKTDRGDVDAIFGQHLESALSTSEIHGKPLRIMFFAHGGLVKESAGIAIASKHVDFWKNNDVYPIYFVWETGLFETLGQLLRRSQEGPRGLVSDYVTDPLIESTARALQGPTIWGGMKFSAERAVAPNGGARYVAEKLKSFCDKYHDKNIDLHAVGHSAGAIFHAHFLSTAHALDVPSFKSAHLLAPAVRVDVFKNYLRDLIGPGGGIDHLSVFTMSKDYERDDNCALIYRKSLLYLIHYALEPEVEEPILGLEQSLRDDPDLQQIFGLTGYASQSADVIFSVTPIDKGKSASTSTTHGGFDDDAPTMNSIARRILGKADADVIAEYESERSAARVVDLWQNQVDWPERVSVSIPLTMSPISLGSSPGLSAPIRAAAQAGRKRALCIGINDYATAPLAGCIADAQEWARSFARLGFETTILSNGEARRSAIVERWRELIAASSPGDVIALQFAGHGTQLPDLNGDEKDGLDEALCPYDFADGAFLIDDDIRDLFSQIPIGVNLTCFFDCCHSGTATRLAIGGSPGRYAAGRGQRQRFIPASDAMKAAHRRFRQVDGQNRSIDPGGQDQMRNILFSACQPHEVAWESDGHGDFTLRATRILAAGTDGMTNQQFADRVTAEFGQGARQRPMLDCADTTVAAQGLLFAPAAQDLPGAAMAAAPLGNAKAEAIQALQRVIETLRTS